MSGVNSGSHITNVPGQTIETCSSNSLTAFPLILSGSRPTLHDYEARMEAITMDFQWGPLTTGTHPTLSPTNSIYLQAPNSDSSSSVLYQSTKYSLYSVQITPATHGSWLLSSTATNTDDLVIILATTSATMQNTFLILVIPIISGSGQDPDYLLNVGATTVPNSYTIAGCFPDNSTTTSEGSTIYATYSTCINGYTNHASTQNVFVAVSTTGLSVTQTTMNRIKSLVSTYSTSATLALPPVLAYLTGTVGAGSARNALLGKTSIRVSDFPTYIATTRYLTDKTIGQLVEKRTDSTSQYQCVELNPDSQLDADGNLVVDVNSGNIYDSTLKDILAERQVLKNLVAPTNPKSSFIGTIIGYVLAILTILAMAIATYVYFYVNLSDVWDTIAGFFICLTFFIATILGLVGYTQQNKNESMIGGYLALAGFIEVILWAAYNSSRISYWLETPTKPLTPAQVDAARAAGTIIPPQPTYLTSILQKVPVYGVIAVLSCLGGFVIGMAFTKN